MSTLPIKVKHIQKSPSFKNIYNCQEALAAQEHFNDKSIYVDGTRMLKENIGEFAKAMYDDKLYDIDQDIVKNMENPDPELVVRELEYELV